MSANDYARIMMNEQAMRTERDLRRAQEEIGALRSVLLVIANQPVGDNVLARQMRNLARSVVEE